MMHFTRLPILAGRVLSQKNAFYWNPHMDILTKIVAHTKGLIEERSLVCSRSELERNIRDMKPARSLRAKMQPGTAHIIAEFKRKSPSRPNINLNADPVWVASQYEAGGASAMSVLTEPGFFAGAPKDLVDIRPAVAMPLLRKDFMVDPYQFFEARSLGADLVLLIARILEKDEIRQFTRLAHDLGMEVLCEIHNAEELEKVGDASVDFLGVNCRDLKHFETNLDHLAAMAEQLPKSVPWVAESGINGPDDVRRLFGAGYQLFLIGEYLMRGDDPVSKLKGLLTP